MTAAVLDPGETIAAAMRELYDQLREIVDRGPTDDPGLLDEIGNLTGRIRRRITRARKKAEPAEPSVPKATPGEDRPRDPGTGATSTATATSSGTTPEGARHTAPATTDAPTRDAVSEDPPTVPRHRAVSLPARRVGEITVPLPHAGRHRLRPARLPLWVHALVILLMVAGVALATVTPWGLAGIPVAAVVLGAARRQTVRRRASLKRGDAS